MKESYHTLADILMEEHETFSDVHGMMGGFHWEKDLLKCCGRFLRGSGMDDALVENKVFGKLVLNQALEGSHYVRALYCMLLVSDLISTLAFQAFWDWCEENDVQIDENVLDTASNVRKLLHQKKRCPDEFQDLHNSSTGLQTNFQTFLQECKERSEVCQYLEVFQEIANVIKFSVTADREGNFALHMGMAETSLPIFRENDCLPYLRYGMHYTETTFALEEKAPEVFDKLIDGYFVVKDREGFFNGVAPDMKLEQTGQWGSKSSGGLVGQTRNLRYMTEWLLVFHEVLQISNSFRELMQEKSMDHSEVAAIHHDLVGLKAVSFNQNLIKLFNYMTNKGNPYNLKTGVFVKMQNLLTRQLIDEEVTRRHLKLIENGDKLVKEIRMERFVQKKKKLSHTISKRSMPRMDFKPNHSSLLAPTLITTKMVAEAQREIDIAKERGMSVEDIYSHDFLPTTSLFDGKLPKKVTSKCQLVTELEHLAKLTEDDKVKPEGELALILDFMSRTRSSTSLPHTCKTFGHLIHWALSVVNEFNVTIVHTILDSYLEASCKAAERLRRGSGIDPIEYDEGDLTADLLLPEKMEKFWPSSHNKVQLQTLLREQIAMYEHLDKNVIVSGCITDADIIPAELYKIGRKSDYPRQEQITCLQSLIEEADDRIIPHCAYEVDSGSKCILII